MVPESNAGAPTMVPSSSSGAGQTGAGVSSAPDAWSAGGLQPGTVLGNRYEIMQALGEGGMGAVYKARDRELDRLVALKVIRPDLARNPAIIQRFKQELILARQVTHRNVIRIFDLGEAGGIKFITMEFIEGKDLHSLLLEHKKFSPEEATEIIRQVCLALDCAHSEGVIHRDLKPQNIMRDAQGRIVVMDFGLARSLQSDGMTQTGALIGTMEYMSPEQGLGQELDQRSDLFTLGLIFYELLTGQVPFKAESALASLLKRTQERAVPVSSLDNKVPRAINDMVAKCLERDPKQRYMSAKELLSDLEAWQGKSAAKSIRLPDVQPWGQGLPWRWIGVAVVVVVLAVTGFLLRGKLFGPAQKGPAGPVVSLAILPFQNASNDPSLDWLGNSLAEMLSSDVGESSQLRMVSPDRLHQVLTDLRVTPDSTIDGGIIGRVAEFSSADTIVTGRYVKFGNQIRIEAKLQDLKHQRSSTIKAEASDQNHLLATVDQLAHSLQENLALSSSAVRDLRASAFKPSTGSVDALRDYSQGLALERQGNHLQAQKSFQTAVTADANFALAYSKLAQTYSELGYDGQAEQFSRRAVDLSANLPEREKYLIEASHDRIIKDTDKAIQTYNNLARISPDDSDVQFALGELYRQTGAYDQAREHYDKVLKRDPKSVAALLGMGQVETYRLDPQDSVVYLNRALELTIQFGNDEQRAKALQYMAVAYRQLDKPDDALRYAQESLDIKTRLGQKQGIAESMHTIAQIHDSQGKLDAALKEYQNAIQIQREIGDNRGLGDALVDLGNLYNERGQYDDALKAYKESLQIERNLGNKTWEAVDLNNIGVMYLNKAQYDDAQSYYQQALQIRQQLKVPGDTADTLHNLGDIASLMGDNDKAVSYYVKALDIRHASGDKRGAAIDSQSMAVVFEQQGRYGAAVKSLDDALNTFRQLQERGYWLAEILAGYGSALNQVGRWQDSPKYLDEAMSLARDMKNQDLIAEITNYQGDRLFYSGDYRGARGFYQQAVQASAHSSDRHLVLISQFNVAKADVKASGSKTALADLKKLAQEADGLSLKYLAVRCSTYVAEGMIDSKDYAHAQDELERLLDRSEKMGLRPELLRIHYQLSLAARQSGNASEAARQLDQARQILGDIRKESGSDTVGKRSDFAAVAGQS